MVEVLMAATLYLLFAIKVMIESGLGSAVLFLFIAPAPLIVLCLLVSRRNKKEDAERLKRGD